MFSNFELHCLPADGIHVRKKQFSCCLNYNLDIIHKYELDTTDVVG